jgi:hypothetical protein
VKAIDSTISIELFKSEYRQYVEEQALYSCVSLLEEDFEHMFVVLKSGEFFGFGFLRICDDYAELNGPFLAGYIDEKTYKELVKKVLRGIRRHYPHLRIYFFTDYPEEFEKFGCEVDFNAPPEVLLKAVPG